MSIVTVFIYIINSSHICHFNECFMTYILIPVKTYVWQQLHNTKQSVNAVHPSTLHMMHVPCR